MNNLELGKVYPGTYKQEGIRLDYNGSFSLYMFLPNLSNEEVKDIQEGDYRFALNLKEDILFFILSFGSSIELSEAPFHFGLYTDNRSKDLPKTVEDGQGIALNIIAVDSITGIVKALRLVGLPTDLSRELIKISISQSHKKFESATYGRKLNKILNSYSSEDLFNGASIKCSGGR